MKKSIVLALLAVVLLGASCITNVTPPAESQFKESGFILSSENETSAGVTYYGGYFDALTTGQTVDMTTKSTFSIFFGYHYWKNFVFAPSLNRNFGLTKVAVNKTGQLTETATIPTIEGTTNAYIIDDNLGVYTTFGSNRFVGLFNPTTMEKLGEIDMSRAKKFENNDRNFYVSIIYRKQDNRLFLPLVTDNTRTPQFYDATDVHVEVINLTTRQWEKTTTFKDATYPITRGNNNNIVDENGNVYIFTQGNYGLDGQLGPRAAKSSRPQILKIPAGSTDFDATYAFNPIDALGFPNLLVQLMLGAVYDANGIAYSCVSAQSESPRILELVQKFALGMLAEAEFAELRRAILYSETQRWVKLDLNAKTVSAINDIPLVAGFGYPSAYKYEGKIYFQFNSDTRKESGFYEYTPSTGRAQKFVAITRGGIALNLIRLSK
jgi:hypothetical protein